MRLLASLIALGGPAAAQYAYVPEALRGDRVDLDGPQAAAVAVATTDSLPGSACTAAAPSPAAVVQEFETGGPPRHAHYTILLRAAVDQIRFMAGQRGANAALGLRTQFVLPPPDESGRRHLQVVASATLARCVQRESGLAAPLTEDGR